MLNFNTIFFSLILPALVCGGIFASASLSRQHNSRGWIPALAVASGYIIGYLGLEGRVPLPPKEGIHWLFYLALISFIAAAVRLLPNWCRWSIRAIISFAIPRLLLDSIFKYTWGMAEETIWWFCLAAAIFGFWTIVERSAAVLPAGASMPFVFLGIAGSSALILALSGSLRQAQHNGIVVAMFAAIWIVALILPRLVNSENAHHVLLPDASAGIALLLSGLWLNGYFFSEVPGISVVLLAVSPILAWVSAARKSTPLQIVLIALPVLIAIGIAVARSGFFGDSGDFV